MVTLKTVSTINEAQIICSRLRSEGVHAFIPDENMVQTYWLVVGAMGGVRIQVFENELEKAQELLSLITPKTSESFISCPKCHSKKTRWDEKMKNIGILVLLFLGFPIPFSTSIVCEDCGHRWKTPKKNTKP